MASESKDVALTSARGKDAKQCHPTSAGDDLFTHAHQMLLKGDLHPRTRHYPQEEEEKKKEEKKVMQDEERVEVRERKRKRRKEKIRHILQRTREDLNTSIPPSPSFSPSLLHPFTPHPPPTQPTGTKKLNSRVLSSIPPLLPIHPPPLSPPSPPPKRSPAPTPPPIRSLPPSPTPTQAVSPPFPHSPSPTAPFYPTPSPLRRTPPASPPTPNPRLTPTMEETEEEMKRKKKVCGVCGDVARSLHFGGRACDSCKAFFRRAVTGGNFLTFTCIRKTDGGSGKEGGGGGPCVVTVQNRRECQACRFARCLRAGMEVSLASRDEDPGLTHGPALGLFRRLSRHAHAHAHARTLHGAPYLAGRWRLPCGPAAPFTPLPKEEGSRHSPPGGEAHPLPASVRLAAAPPQTPASAPLPFLLRQSPPLPQDHTDPRHTTSPSDLHLHAVHGLSHEFIGADPTHHLSPTPTHNPAPIQKRVPAPPPTTTHRPLLGHHAPLTRPSAVLAPPDLVPPPTRLPRWPGGAPAWASPEPTNNWRPDPPRGRGGGGPRPAPPTVPALPRDGLTPQDREEIEQLEDLYAGSLESVTALMDEHTARMEEVGRIYTAFIERRAKFLVNTPRYGTVAAADRAKLLHVAVAMSTYYMGALHMDISDYTWRRHQRNDGGGGGGDGGGPSRKFGGSGAVLSVSSARQLLTHQQFVHVMKFYTTYREVLADETVTILMQVMSLFYPEAGLEAPCPVEEGRLHYLALLSRYLATRHGPKEGARRLAALLTSQQEARQLVEVLRTVDLTPREPRLALGTSRTMLADRIQLVCEAARRGWQTRDPGVGTPACPTYGPATPPSHTYGTHSPPTPASCTHSPPTPPAQSSGTAVGLEQVGRLVARLASCEDPATLAEARRILPAPLLRRFLHLLQDPPPPRLAPHTTPPPQCTPPSPSPSPPSLHKGVTHTAGEPPAPPPPVPPSHRLHLLPPSAHPPELAAE